MSQVSSEIVATVVTTGDCSDNETVPAKNYPSRQRWRSSGATLPAGWHEAVSQLAAEWNVKSQAIFTAALDDFLVLAAKDWEKARAKVLKVQQLSDDVPRFLDFAARHVAGTSTTDLRRPAPSQQKRPLKGLGESA
jgi:hypothetical protein